MSEEQKMKQPIKRMSIQEFIDGGFLQEVNRQVLHPCGLAMEVKQEDDGTYSIGGVWDYRNDPEGIIFDFGNRADIGTSLEKAENVEEAQSNHVAERIALLGSMIEPIVQRE